MFESISEKIFESYKENTIDFFSDDSKEKISKLVNLIFSTHTNGKKILICGNGGSAANSLHIANDMLCTLSHSTTNINVLSLAANISTISCIANDYGYDEIFSRQILSNGDEGDLLIALSGSGNSDNIIKAIKTAKERKILTAGIIGFDGGKSKDMLDLPLHFEVHDMQVCEDIQLIFMHMVSKVLFEISKASE